MAQGIARTNTTEADLTTEKLLVPEVDRSAELLRAADPRGERAAEAARDVEHNKLEYNQMLEHQWATRQMSLASTAGTAASDIRTREMAMQGEVSTAFSYTRRKRGMSSRDEDREELLAALLIHFKSATAAMDCLDAFVAKTTGSHQAGQSALVVTTTELTQVAADLARRLTNGDTLLQLHISHGEARQAVANLIVDRLEGHLSEADIRKIHELVMERIDPARNDAPAPASASDISLVRVEVRPLTEALDDHTRTVVGRFSEYPLISASAAYSQRLEAITRGILRSEFGDDQIRDPGFTLTGARLEEVRRLALRTFVNELLNETEGRSNEFAEALALSRLIKPEDVSDSARESLRRRARAALEADPFAVPPGLLRFVGYLEGALLERMDRALVAAPSEAARRLIMTRWFAGSSESDRQWIEEESRRIIGRPLGAESELPAPVTAARTSLRTRLGGSAELVQLDRTVREASNLPHAVAEQRISALLIGSPRMLSSFTATPGTLDRDLREYLTHELSSLHPTARDRLIVGIVARLDAARWDRIATMSATPLVDSSAFMQARGTTHLSADLQNRIGERALYTGAEPRALIEAGIVNLAIADRYRESLRLSADPLADIRGLRARLGDEAWIRFLTRYEEATGRAFLGDLEQLRPGGTLLARAIAERPQLFPQTILASFAERVYREDALTVGIMTGQRSELAQQLAERRAQAIDLVRRIPGAPQVVLIGTEPNFDARFNELMVGYLRSIGVAAQITPHMTTVELVRLVPVPFATVDPDGHRRVLTLVRCVDDMTPAAPNVTSWNLPAQIAYLDSHIATVSARAGIERVVGLGVVSADRRIEIDRTASLELSHLRHQLALRADAGHLDPDFISLRNQRDALEWAATQRRVQLLLLAGRGEEARRTLLDFNERNGTGSLIRGPEYVERSNRQIAVLTDILEGQQANERALTEAMQTMSDAARRYRADGRSDTPYDAPLAHLNERLGALRENRGRVFQLLGEGNSPGVLASFDGDRDSVLLALNRVKVEDSNSEGGVRSISRAELEARTPVRPASLTIAIVDFRTALNAGQFPDATSIAVSFPAVSTSVGGGYERLLGVTAPAPRGTDREALAAWASVLGGTPEHRAMIAAMPSGISDGDALAYVVARTPAAERWQVQFFVACHGRGKDIERWLAEGNGSDTQRSAFAAELARARDELQSDPSLNPAARERRAYERALAVLIRVTTPEMLGVTVPRMLAFVELAAMTERADRVLSSFSAPYRAGVLELYRVRQGHSFGQTLLHTVPAGGDVASLLLVRRYDIVTNGEWAAFFPNRAVPTNPDAFASGLRASVRTAGSETARVADMLRPETELYARERAAMVALLSLVSRTEDRELIGIVRTELRSLEINFEATVNARILELDRATPGVRELLERGRLHVSLRCRVDAMVEPGIAALRDSTGDPARAVRRVTELLRQDRRQEALDLIRHLNFTPAQLEVFRVLYREGIGLRPDDSSAGRGPRSLERDLLGGAPTPEFAALVALVVIRRPGYFMTIEARDAQLTQYDLSRVRAIVASGDEAALIRFLVDLGSRERWQRLERAGFTIPTSMRDASALADAMRSNDPLLARVIALHSRLATGRGDNDELIRDLALLRLTPEFDAIAVGYANRYGRALIDDMQAALPAEARALAAALMRNDRQAIAVEIAAWALRLHVRTGSAEINHALLNLVPSFAPQAIDRFNVLTAIEDRCQTQFRRSLAGLLTERGGQLGRADYVFVTSILGQRGAFPEAAVRVFIQNREQVVANVNSLERGRSQLLNLIGEARGAADQIDAQRNLANARASSWAAVFNEGTSAARQRAEAFAALHQRQQLHIRTLETEVVAIYNRGIANTTAFGCLALEDIVRGDSASASMNLQQLQRETSSIQTQLGRYELTQVRRADLQLAHEALRQAQDTENRYRFWTGAIYGTVKMLAIVGVSILATPATGILLAGVWELAELGVNVGLRGFTWREGLSNAAFNFALNATGCLLTAFRVGVSVGRFAVFNRHTEEFVARSFFRMFFTAGGRQGAAQAVERITLQGAMDAADLAFAQSWVKEWTKLAVRQLFGRSFNIAPGAALPFLGAGLSPFGNPMGITVPPLDINPIPLVVAPAALAVGAPMLGAAVRRDNQNGEPPSTTEPSSPNRPTITEGTPERAAEIMRAYEPLYSTTLADGRQVWAYSTGDGQTLWVHQLGEQRMYEIRDDQGRPTWAYAVGFENPPTWLDSSWYSGSTWQSTGVRTWEYNPAPADFAPGGTPGAAGPPHVAGVPGPDVIGILLAMMKRYFGDRGIPPSPPSNPPPGASGASASGTTGGGTPPVVPPGGAGGASIESIRDGINSYIIQQQREGLAVAQQLQRELIRLQELTGGVPLRAGDGRQADGQTGAARSSDGGGNADAAAIRQQLARVQELVTRLAALIPPVQQGQPATNGQPSQTSIPGAVPVANGATAPLGQLTPVERQQQLAESLRRTLADVNRLMQTLGLVDANGQATPAGQALAAGMGGRVTNPAPVAGAQPAANPAAIPGAVILQQGSVLPGANGTATPTASGDEEAARRILRAGIEQLQAQAAHAERAFRALTNLTDSNARPGSDSSSAAGRNAAASRSSASERSSPTSASNAGDSSSHGETLSASSSSSSSDAARRRVAERTPAGMTGETAAALPGGRGERQAGPAVSSASTDATAPSSAQSMSRESTEQRSAELVGTSRDSASDSGSRRRTAERSESEAAAGRGLEQERTVSSASSEGVIRPGSMSDGAGERGPVGNRAGAPESGFTGSREGAVSTESAGGAGFRESAERPSRADRDERGEELRSGVQARIARIAAEQVVPVEIAEAASNRRAESPSQGTGGSYSGHERAFRAGDARFEAASEWHPTTESARGGADRSSSNGEGQTMTTVVSDDGTGAPSRSRDVAVSSTLLAAIRSAAVLDPPADSVAARDGGIASERATPQSTSAEARIREEQRALAARDVAEASTRAVRTGMADSMLPAPRINLMDSRERPSAQRLGEAEELAARPEARAEEARKEEMRRDVRSDSDEQAKRKAAARRKIEAAKKKREEVIRMRDMILWQLSQIGLSKIMSDRLRTVLREEHEMSDQEIDRLVLELRKKQGIADEPSSAPHTAEPTQELVKPLAAPLASQVIRAGSPLERQSKTKGLTRAELYRKLLAERQLKSH